MTAPSRIGKVMVGAYVPPKTRKKLKLLAIAQDSTISALLVEAIGLLLEQYRRT